MGVAMHQLNIKNAETYKLATELRELTGESLASVVKTALKEKLEREKQKQGREGIAKKLMEIGRQYREAAGDGPFRTVKEIEDELYDENGLPR
jgi:antitoxin VapB